MPTALDSWGHRGQWWTMVWFSTAKYTVSFLSEMSCQQCCVWSCCSRKERCPHDVGGALVCGCNEVRFTDCPKSANILTLHNIACMPDDTKKTTIAQINLMRSAVKGKKWEPDGDGFICNLHYEGFVGPSRKLPNRIPEYFARPLSSAPVKKKQCCRGRIGRKAHRQVIHLLKKAK